MIGDHCKLQIADIYPEDEGKYSCRAVNASGEATTSCFVTVEGKSCPIAYIYKLLLGFLWDGVINLCPFLPCPHQGKYLSHLCLCEHFLNSLAVVNVSVILPIWELSLS